MEPILNTVNEAENLRLGGPWAQRKTYYYYCSLVLISVLATAQSASLRNRKCISALLALWPLPGEDNV